MSRFVYFVGFVAFDGDAFKFRNAEVTSNMEFTTQEHVLGAGDKLAEKSGAEVVVLSCTLLRREP